MALSDGGLSLRWGSKHHRQGNDDDEKKNKNKNKTTKTSSLSSSFGGEGGAAAAAAMEVDGDDDDDDEGMRDGVEAAANGEKKDDDDDDDEGKSSQQRPKSAAVPKNPAVCLLTGKILAAHWGREGNWKSIRAHTKAISPNAGVFLLLRSTRILLVSNGLLSYYGSPYVDSHGEMDIELARGHMLYLDPERVQALVDLVREQRVADAVARDKMDQARRRANGVRNF